LAAEASAGEFLLASSEGEKQRFPSMQFPTTRWDELAQASLHGDSTAREALDRFCRKYWDPVNAFLRWKGYNEADAADLTQDFFLNFLETRSWRRADPLRGSFRTFLLGALANRLKKAHAHDTRLKRGGGEQIVSLDDAENDQLAVDLPTVPPAAAAHFDRTWALQVVAAALARTREIYSASAKQPIFDALKSFLSLRQQPKSYETAAESLAVSLASVKTEIHRLRHTFRLAMRLEIGQTVSAPHEIDAELHHLRAALANHEFDSEPTGET
jgi:RNA polymerase sigma factor (sigma-70 family)